MSTTPAGLRAVPDLPAIAPAELLDQVAAFVSRFSVFPDRHTAPMLALWYAHTHAVQHFYTTPRLILDSAEPGSGKTRVLEVAQYLVRKPEMTISITTAAIFRMLCDGPVTLLFDEIDAVFSPKGGGNNEDLRGLLNSGYKRSATVSRCVGDASRMKVERFPVFAPVALAGIAGAMPATITTRAITVHMRRRAPHERAEAFRERRVDNEATPLREQLAAWLDMVGEDELVGAEPVMPEQVTDRAAEVWEPLLAIADLAGGHWPDTARAAAMHFVGQATETGTSVGTRLLADLRALFTAHEAERMATSDIIGRLCADEEAGWADLDGRPLDARRLARELARYGVRPGPLRIGGHVAKGYHVDGALSDAFARYLPPTTEPAPAGAVTTVTPVTPQVRGVTDPDRVTAPTVTPPVEPLPDDPPEQISVTDAAVTPRSAVMPLTRHVTAVTDVTATDGGAR
ncbi:MULTISPECIES: DUF3631 domain-containing protein [Pseudonocardia]|uniref:DUF3631 domain-containing protein n=2 Tax=Pseudonocardia TaxID=1847 RepID=A0A1Y2N3V4_PSEAH|nr:MULTISPECIES: DUF3631 domain-containing protein [Pseudonocardia]OSY42183.1 hypothetical protein BG845_01681 [Pseudonocardia autotrophica]TDN75049.1 uncharacterized protein DUF3631 [Pseudonocardia autotrophica]BBF98993.1 hypothetical protein Pdca_02030 [Pseudonocardia autotrophica]GEC23913.1 hypothetical protein PSA01_09420 [Pseudonocardia saturnea]